MHMLHSNPAQRLRRDQQLREAILLSFCDPLPEACLRLKAITRGEWQKLLRWLDISGLALYFLDRLVEVKHCELIPPGVLARLLQNLADNTERTNGLFMESADIQRSFVSAGLSYAMLKGFSLWPSSVTRPELRSQLDLDFLVSEQSAPEARNILEARGYYLHAISGRSWEFKANPMPRQSLSNLYKASPHRSVELHLEMPCTERASLLDRTEKRCFRGIRMPVLSAVDLFLGQGLHLYKHVSNDFARTSHLIEFRRHVIARSDDMAFWAELRSHAGENPRAQIGLGVVTLLITRVMGSFAPEAFTSWTVDCLPAAARLWVEMYGHRTVLASFPGTKLYLLLQKELEAAGAPAKRSLRRALLPLRLPTPVVHAKKHETLPETYRRLRTQLQFILFRLHFHIVEGLRYLCESWRWRQRLNGLAS